MDNKARILNGMCINQFNCDRRFMAGVIEDVTGKINTSINI